jgi:DNA primase
MTTTKWIQIAKDLPINSSTQTECPTGCGSGEKLSVNHSNKDYWCFCYRCGFTETVHKGKQTLADIQKIQKLNEAAETPIPLELPNDFTTEIPLAGRLWLYKAGITEQCWRKNNIGYSEVLQRVVLPVYNQDGELVWLQCRAIHSQQKPKYLQPSRDRSTVIFSVSPDRDDNERVVVVEDILSAIRVGKHIRAISLLGTKITTAQAAMLGHYKRVTTWLDSDEAGRRGAYKIRRTLGLITEVDNIVTKLDPKALSDKEILEELRK